MPTKKAPVTKRAPKTVKEKKFAKEYLSNGGNATQAALVAYDTGSYSAASTIASENMSKLDFDNYFELAGLTDEVIAQAITYKALTAKKRDQFTGEVEDDHAEQRKNLELALKIMGKFAPVKQDVTSKGEKIVMPILGGLSIEEEEAPDAQV